MPRSTVARGSAVATLVLIETLDQVIALTNVESSTCGRLQYIDKKSPVRLDRALGLAGGGKGSRTPDLPETRPQAACSGRSTQGERYQDGNA